MADKTILHMLSPTRHVSPFDVNMALDAGFDAVLPYDDVQADEVAGLVQDAIFSRPPKLAVRTGVFIGGKNATEALDWMAAARKAMVPPFIISVFADPAGSFTTAAAMVAKTAKCLHDAHSTTLSGKRVTVFGATGVVGFASGVIAALEGARVTLAGHDGRDRVAKSADEIERRFGVTVEAADARDEDRKSALVAASEIVFCAGRAGVQIISRAQVDSARDLLVAADVNAVPPMGVEGLDVHADGTPLNDRVRGIGALAIGRVKYDTQSGLFRRMIASDRPVAFDFRDAFAFAQDRVG